jgi:hypothetical protein
MTQRTLPNPYDSSATTSPTLATLRSVRRHFVFALLALAVSLFTAAPGLILLNQEWQIFPFPTFVGAFDSDGSPIPDATVLRYSFVGGGTFFCLSLFFAALGATNRRRNRRISQCPPIVSG